MRKKVLSILLIISLMASMLIGLTGCGEDDEEDEVHSSNKEAKSTSEAFNVVSSKEASSPEEFVEIFVNYVNNGDVENIIDSIDIVGMYATAMSMPESSYVISTGDEPYERRYL